MKVEFISLGKNDSCLSVLKTSPTTANLIHSNHDNSYFTYHFEIEGTKEEIETITKFCKLIENAKPKIEAE